MLPGEGLLARAARGVGVGVAGQTGKASEGFYSNWERLAFYGQGNDARNCKGRRVGWSRGEKMRGVRTDAGWGWGREAVTQYPDIQGNMAVDVPSCLCNQT